ncbi:MAG: DUF5050 domain-containing protein [Clostridia bacterium]|nr:DUF5050 domain-containing protein [Clostridia bacterium]
MKRLIPILISIVLIAVSAAPESYAVDKADSTKYGNTTGNISNKGLAAESGGWVYFVNMLDKETIYKYRKGSKNAVKVNSDPSCSISVLGEWVYYCKLPERNIYRIKTNGTGRQKLNSDKSSDVNVVNDWIFYVNDSDTANIYKMKTDGGKRQKYLDGRFNNLCVKDGFMYYVDSECYVGKTSLSNSKIQRIRESRDFIMNLNVEDGWIYYSSDALYKIKTDGTQAKQLSKDDARYINVVGDTIFYTRNGQIHKIRTDGTEKQKIDNKYSKNVMFINFADNQLYFLNYSNNIYKVKKDGTRREKLLDGNSVSRMYSYNGKVYIVQPGEILNMNPDGTGVNETCTLERNLYDPVWYENGYVYYSDNVNLRPLIYNEETGTLSGSFDSSRPNDPKGHKIFSITVDGRNKKAIYETSNEFRIFCIDGGWVYFIEQGKVYKLKTDGTKKQDMSKTGLQDIAGFKYLDEVITYGGWIYISGTKQLGGSDELYKVKADGKSKVQSLAKGLFRYLDVDGSWIYFNSCSDGKIYKVKTDGSSKTQVIKNRCGDLYVEGEWIYYRMNFYYSSYDGSSRGILYRAKKDGSGQQVVSNDSIEEILFVNKDWIFYSIEDNIYKMNTDGSGAEESGIHP